MIRIGSLFTGCGMLDVAVEEVFGGTTIWCAEFDQAASAVLAGWRPDVPNLGDVTQIRWEAVTPVDILCGGFPCQDVSAAGRRAGLAQGTRSGLWACFAEAVEVLHPQLVVIENVKGLLSAKAHRASELEREYSRLGTQLPVLRAAGAVLGDLAALGYDAQWTTIPASDVGAPHRRERVFILAHPAQPRPQGRGGFVESGGRADARGCVDRFADVT